MKCDGKMSFKDYVFPVNPRTIRISSERKLASGRIPFGEDAVSDLGAAARIISGEGEFFGESCISDFEGLKRVMDQGGPGMLYIPSQSPICASAQLLEFDADDREGIIRYRFRFVESPSYRGGTQSYVYGDGSGCLWDIAYRCGISTDMLISLNPHIMRPDIPVKAGERVRLC